MPPKANLIGCKFSSLLVIDTRPSIKQSAVWHCLCDCGNEIDVLAASLKSGNTSSCGCFKRKLNKEQILTARLFYTGKFEPRISSARVVWQDYKENDLTFDQFLMLSQMICWYCGTQPSRKFNSFLRKKGASQFRIDNGEFIYNGLDRIDSDKLHSIDNVVTSCFVCNRAKSNLSLENFRQHLISILSFRKNNYDNSFVEIQKKLILHFSNYEIINVANDCKNKKRYLPPILSAAKIAFSFYKKDGITFEEFLRLSQSNCVYCGQVPSNSIYSSKSNLLKDRFIYNGLDRIDSSINHIINNVVPSCWNCNRMKSNSSIADFDTWLTNINNHWINK